MSLSKRSILHVHREIRVLYTLKKKKICISDLKCCLDVNKRPKRTGKWLLCEIYSMYMWTKPSNVSPKSKSYYYLFIIIIINIFFTYTNFSIDYQNNGRLLFCR